MRRLKELFDNNRAWAKGVDDKDPAFFKRLAAQQKPPYLWIGCADSRVPANQILGLDPGEVFVHRNIANVVSHTDFSCLSVMQYAVEVLEVKHIIVCGHYGCGGVRGALGNQPLGLIDNWLRQIKDACEVSGMEMSGNLDKDAHTACEVNVAAQVRNVCQSTVVQDAWRRGQDLCVHGWVYSLEDGLLRDLGLCAANAEEGAQLPLLPTPV